MNNFIVSNLSDKLTKSVTLEIGSKAKNMIANGIKVNNLTLGEPDFTTPEYIGEGAIEAINKGLIKYTNTLGIEELRKLICRKLKEENNLSYEVSNIIVSAGAKQALINSLLAIVNEGDEVLIPTPFWVSYPEMVKIAKGTPKFIHTGKESNYKINRKLLEEEYTPKVKALILNNPSNPTGIVYKREELEEIAEFAVEKNIFVISDEIYEKLIYDEKYISFASISDEAKKLTVTINGFSKSHAMTGWRLGYAVAEAHIIDAMSKFQGHMTSNASTVSQYAGITALKVKDGSLEDMFNAFKSRRNLVVEELNKIKEVSYIFPEGAFYIFINISNSFNKTYNDKVINTSMDFCKVLLDDFKVAVLPGEAFGAGEFIRMSYAASEEQITGGISAIGELFLKLK